MDIIAEINQKFQVALTQIVYDGKIHRFGPDKKDDKCWYVAREWTFKGQIYQEVTYGSWVTGDKITWQSWDKSQMKDRSFKVAYKKNTEESQAKLELEIQHKHKDCKEKWQPIFNAATPGVVHDYLKFKGIDRSFTARTDSRNVLLIPVYKPSGFVGVQRILFNESTQKFEKRFSSGIEIKGGFCPLMPFKNAEFVFVSEGFATAASIQLAFPDIPSICVFSANNILPAIEAIRHVNPKCKITIAADRDENGVGEKYARQAVKSLISIIYKIPTFGSKNPAWTDFNDLHQFESIENVKSQLEIDPTDFSHIITLGYNEDVYYYTSSENPQIVPVTAAKHGKSNFLDLCALPFWYKHYGIKDEEGNYITINWLKAESDLKEQCRKKGFFDPQKVRGRGVWTEKNKIIINNGEKLLIDGKELKDFKAEYHYLRAATVPLKITRPLTDDESMGLLSVFGSLSYKNKKDYIYISAWIIQAQIFAIMPWRFHIWIVGSKGTGKSTILKWIGDLVINCSKDVDSTAAGIRQDLKSDARAVVYDESEPNNDKLKSLLDMARQTSSNNGFDTKRGTVGGKGLIYNVQTVFCLGSIQKTIENSADASRYFIVDMESNKGQSRTEYAEMLSRIKHFSEKKDQLFTRAVQSASSILSSYNTAQGVLASMDIEARMVDQISAVIANFWVYVSMEPITVEQATFLINDFELTKSEYTKANEIADTEECWTAIMSMPLNNLNHSVGHAIEMLNHSVSSHADEEWESHLGFHGMKYEKSKSELFIASSSPHIKKKLPHFKDYAAIMRRDKTKYVKDDQKRISAFGGRPKGIILKLDRNYK